MRWLLNIDRRIIFLLVLVAIVAAFFVPMKMPIVPSKPVLGAFEGMDRLPARAPVLIAMDYDPASRAELVPMNVALLRHAFQKDCRIIGMTMWPNNVSLADELMTVTAGEFDDVEVRAILTGQKGATNVLLEQIARGTVSFETAFRAAEREGATRTGTFNPGYGRGTDWCPFSREVHDALGSGTGLVRRLVPGAGDKWCLMEVTKRTPTKRYGHDYVFLGYQPGTGVLVINMGQNLYAAFPTDQAGTRTSEIPMLKDVRSLRDIKYVVDIAAGNTGEVWVVYGHEKYGFPMAIGCTAVIAPDLYPYYAAHQITGILGGIKGAWEYEKLIDRPGEATDRIPAQTVSHCLVIVLILFCNVAYFLVGRKQAAAR